jgi:hypothetical protein
LVIEVIDRWKRVEACNYNREVELDCNREDKESRLLERQRNLEITPSDDGRMHVELLEKLKSWHDDEAEHWRWRENAEAWQDRMYKVHRDYKYAEKRRDGGAVENDLGV